MSAIARALARARISTGVDHSAIGSILGPVLDEITAEAADSTFEAQGLAEISAALARNQTEWETVTEEAIGDLTGWTLAVPVSLLAASGAIYNDNTVGTAPHFAYKLFAGGALGPLERARIVCTLTLPAASGAGGTYFGIVNSATPTIGSGDWFGNSLLVGFSGSNNQPFKQGGAANAGAQDSATLSTTARAAGTYVLVLDIDEHFLSFSILDLLGNQRASQRYARTAQAGAAHGFAASAILDGDIYGMSIFSNDNRSVNGVKVGPIVFRRGHVARRTLTAGGASLLTGPGILHSGVSVNTFLDDHFTLTTPPGWDGLTELPLIYHCHGSSNNELNPFAGTTGQLTLDHSAMTSALLQAGYAVLCPWFLSDTHWGNPNVMKAAPIHLRRARELLPLGKVGMLGFSMGALTAYNILARRTVPNIVAVAGLYPALSLAAAYAGAYTSAINTAYGCSAGTYAAVTSGYDPLLRDPADFQNVPSLLIASPDDTSIPKVSNTDPFATRINGAGMAVTVQAASGPHGDPTHFDSATVTAFFNTAFAAAAT